MQQDTKEDPAPPVPPHPALQQQHAPHHAPQQHAPVPSQPANAHQQHSSKATAHNQQSEKASFQQHQTASKGNPGSGDFGGSSQAEHHDHPRHDQQESHTGPQQQQYYIMSAGHGDESQQQCSSMSGYGEPQQQYYTMGAGHGDESQQQYSMSGYGEQQYTVSGQHMSGQQQQHNVGGELCFFDLPGDILGVVAKFLLHDRPVAQSKDLCANFSFAALPCSPARGDGSADEDPRKTSIFPLCSALYGYSLLVGRYGERSVPSDKITATLYDLLYLLSAQELDLCGIGCCLFFTDNYSPEAEAHKFRRPNPACECHFDGVGRDYGECVGMCCAGGGRRRHIGGLGAIPAASQSASSRQGSLFWAAVVRQQEELMAALDIGTVARPARLGQLLPLVLKRLANTLPYRVAPDLVRKAVPTHPRVAKVVEYYLLDEGTTSVGAAGAAAPDPSLQPNTKTGRLTGELQFSRGFWSGEEERRYLSEQTDFLAREGERRLEGTTDHDVRAGTEAERRQTAGNVVGLFDKNRAAVEDDEVLVKAAPVDVTPESSEELGDYRDTVVHLTSDELERLFFMLLALGDHWGKVRGSGKLGAVMRFVVGEFFNSALSKPAHTSWLPWWSMLETLTKQSCGQFLLENSNFIGEQIVILVESFYKTEVEKLMTNRPPREVLSTTFPAWMETFGTPLKTIRVLAASGLFPAKNSRAVSLLQTLIDSAFKLLMQGLNKTREGEAFLQRYRLAKSTTNINFL